MKNIILLIICLTFFNCSDDKILKLKTENDYLYKRITSLKEEIKKLAEEKIEISEQNFKSQYDNLMAKTEKLEKENYNYTFRERNTNMKISYYNELLHYLLKENNLSDIEISGIVSPIDENKKGIIVIAENVVTKKKYNYTSKDMIKRDKELFFKYKLILPIGIYHLHAEYLDKSFFDNYKFEGYIAIHPEIKKDDINIYQQ